MLDWIQPRDYTEPAALYNEQNEAVALLQWINGGGVSVEFEDTLLFLKQIGTFRTTIVAFEPDAMERIAVYKAGLGNSGSLKYEDGHANYQWSQTNRHEWRWQTQQGQTLINFKVGVVEGQKQGIITPEGEVDEKDYQLLLLVGWYVAILNGGVGRTMTSPHSDGTNIRF